MAQAQLVENARPQLLHRGRKARSPRTAVSLSVPERSVITFKSGLAMEQRANELKGNYRQNIEDGIHGRADRPALRFAIEVELPIPWPRSGCTRYLRRCCGGWPSGQRRRGIPSTYAPR